MPHTGYVLKVYGSTATVRTRLQREACSACKACGTCSDKALQDCLDLQLAVPDSIQPGDSIELEIRLPNQFVVALIVFGTPLAGMLLGGALAYRIVAPTDPAAVIGGLAGLICSFGFIRLAERRFTRLKPGGRFIRKAPGKTSDPHTC